MPKRVTMQHIANKVGVSKYAVSKALSGKIGVSEKTRSRIVLTATQMGYFLQRQSSAVVRKETLYENRSANTIVILMPNVRRQNRDSSFWGRIVDGITAAVRQRGLGIIIVTEHAPNHVLQVVNPRGILGIVGVGLVSNSLLLEIRNLGLPLVLIDHEDETVMTDTVFVNNIEGTKQLTNYLIGRGHQSFQFVGGIHYSPSFYDRWLGFRLALESAGISLSQNASLIQMMGTDQNEHIDRMSVQVHEMMKTGNLPTAFVCANDSLAISLMTALQKQGMQIPRDVSVTGFDDIDEAGLVEPAITTIHVDKERMGARAVDLLLRRIDEPLTPREKLLLCGNVRLRDSTGHAGSLHTLEKS